MGLLDLPSPVLSWIDAGLLHVLPPLVAVLLWAAVAAFLSVELYRWLSPQRRIRGLRQAIETERRQAMAVEEDFAEAWPHLRRMMGLALRRVGIVLPATLIASLPLLVLLAWLDNAYGKVFPDPGGTVAVAVAGEQAQGYRAHWRDGTLIVPPRVTVLDGEGLPTVYQGVVASKMLGSNVVPVRSIAHATASSRSATERRARP